MAWPVTLRRGLWIALLVGLPAVGTACADPAGVSPRVAIAVEPGRVVIANRSAEPIHTYVIGRAQSISVLWGPCVEANCGQVAVDAEYVVTIPSALVHSTETEALVYWWTSTRTASGARVPSRVHSQVVTLEHSRPGP